MLVLMHGAMPPQSADALHVNSEHVPPDDDELDEDELPLDDDEEDDDDDPLLEDELPLDEELPPPLLVLLLPELELQPMRHTMAPKHATIHIRIRSHTRVALVDHGRPARAG